MKILLFIALLFIPVFASAEIYKCDIDGKLVFSDRVCQYNADSIELKPTNGMTATEVPEDQSNIVDQVYRKQVANAKRSRMLMAKRVKSGKNCLTGKIVNSNISRGGTGEVTYRNALNCGGGYYTKHYAGGRELWTDGKERGRHGAR
jgi:hypothetical protein